MVWRVASERKTQSFKYQLPPFSTIDFPHSLSSPSSTPLPSFYFVVLSHIPLCKPYYATITQALARETERNHSIFLYQFLQRPHDLYYFPPIPSSLLLITSHLPFPHVVQFHPVTLTASPPFPCFTRRDPFTQREMNAEGIKLR